MGDFLEADKNRDVNFPAYYQMQVTTSALEQISSYIYTVYICNFRYLE